MDGKYQLEVSELHTILKKGIEELCKHAKRNNFLEYPYGRNANPTPLLTEEDFINQLGGPDCDDSEPVFEYSYGFDPLKFLSDYIVWAHPKTVENRQLAKINAQARLQFRAQHALRQIETQRQLIERIGQMQAGILWGPIAHAESGTRVFATFQPLKPSTVYLQSAGDSQFSTILHTIRLVVPGPSLFTHVELPKLTSGSACFLRCFAIPLDEQGLQSDHLTAKMCAPVHLTEYDEEFQNVQDRWKNAFACVAWTFPMHGEIDLSDPTASPLDPVLQFSFLGQFPSSFQAAPANATGKKKDRQDDPRKLSGAFLTPHITYLLGDPLVHNTDASYAADPLPGYLTQLSSFFSQLLSMSDLSGVRRSSLQLAWRDSHPLSGQTLRLEEVAHRSYRHEMKRYYKKYGLEEPGSKSKSKSKTGANAATAKANVHIPPPPPYKRPLISPQQQAIMQAFPIISFPSDPAPAPATAAEAEATINTACRQLYHSKLLSPEVLVITLDLRRGLGKQAQGISDYLGREQADWLAHTLKYTQASWKLIVCGKSFGIAAFHDTILSSSSSAAEGGGGLVAADDLPAGQESKVSGASVEEVAQISAGLGSTAPVRAGDSVEEESLRLEPPTSTTSSHASNLYDDVDEVYGRSKYSLQHILGEYQRKTMESSTSSLPSVLDLQPFETIGGDTWPSFSLEAEAARSGNAHAMVYLTSGIVLLTSGVSSCTSRTFQPVPAMASSTLSTEPSSTSEGGGAGAAGGATTGPSSRPGTGQAKGAATASASTSAVPQYTVAFSSVEDILTPCYLATFDALQARSTLPVAVRPSTHPGGAPTVGYCCEVSLGHGKNLAATSATAKQWKYVPGMSATTRLFLPNHSDEEEEEEEDHVVACEMQLLANNSLFLELYAVPVPSARGERCRRKLASVSLGLAVPIAEPSEDSVGDSVHIA